MAHQRSSNTARNFALDAHLILDKTVFDEFPTEWEERTLFYAGHHDVADASVTSQRDFRKRDTRGRVAPKRVNVSTFESNVLYTLRFMVDRAVVGGNWLELPTKNYRVAQQQRKGELLPNRV